MSRKDAAASAWGGRKARTTIMSKNANSIYSRFRRWRRYRETVRELQTLSNDQLRDLGIEPTEISRLAREASRL